MDIAVSLDNVFGAPCIERQPEAHQNIDPNSAIDVKANVCMAGMFSCDTSGSISGYIEPTNNQGDRVTYKCDSIDPGVQCRGDPVIKCVRSIHLRPFRTEFAHKGHNYHQCEVNGKISPPHQKTRQPVKIRATPVL